MGVVGDRLQTLGEDARSTVSLAAPEAPGGDADHDGTTLSWQIVQHALAAAVDGRPAQPLEAA